MLYGNAVLVRGRILDQQHVALPAPDVEPRGVLFVDAEVDGAWFTFGCTHLEPRPTARRAPARSARARFCGTFAAATSFGTSIRRPSSRR